MQPNYNAKGKKKTTVKKYLEIINKSQNKTKNFGRIHIYDKLWTGLRKIMFYKPKVFENNNQKSLNYNNFILHAVKATRDRDF